MQCSYYAQVWKITQRILQILNIQWIMVPTAFVEICCTFWIDRISVSTGVSYGGFTEKPSVDVKELCSSGIFFFSSTSRKENANEIHPEIYSLALRMNNPTTDVGKSGRKANSHRHSPSPLSALS